VLRFLSRATQMAHECFLSLRTTRRIKKLRGYVDRNVILTFELQLVGIERLERRRDTRNRHGQLVLKPMPVDGIDLDLKRKREGISTLIRQVILQFDVQSRFGVSGVVSR
jgi:hypothetical protein